MPNQFAEAAQDIYGRNPPAWMLQVLAKLASGVTVRLKAEDSAPSPELIREKLATIVDACGRIERQLSDLNVLSRLESAEGELVGWPQSLRWLAERARTAQGLIPEGRGRKAADIPANPDGLSAATYCALCVSRVWYACRQEHVAAESHLAHTAADSFWKACTAPIERKTPGWKNAFSNARQVRLQAEREEQEAAQQRAAEPGARLRFDHPARLLLGVIDRVVDEALASRTRM